MCVVSYVSDHYRRDILPGVWPNSVPYYPPNSKPQYPNWPKAPYRGADSLEPGVSRKEFEALRDVVDQMKKDLIVAKAQDIADGTPDCEMDEKVEMLKYIAKIVGVDLKEIFN